MMSSQSDSTKNQSFNDDLVLLKRYFDDNGLTPNVRKTKYVHFHSPPKRLNRDVVVNVNGGIVEEVRVFLYLGLYLDSHLSFKLQVGNIARKIGPAGL